MEPRSLGRCSIVVALAAALGLPAAASGEPAATSPPAAPACSEEGSAAGVPTVASLLDLVRRSAEGRAPGEEPIEALDGRGYNYGPAPDPLAELPLREPR